MRKVEQERVITYYLPSMKILVTGTHLTPALAVIEELKKSYNAEIVYAGRKTTLEGDNVLSVESQILPKMGVKFIPLITGRLQREFTLYTIPSLLKIPIGLLQSLYIIFSEKPDVVLSFGGYVAAPVILTSWLFSIPIIIHEQTLVSGLANKISAFFADKIATSFNSTSRGKTILTGNPIRKEILHPLKKISPDFNKLFKISKKEKIPTILIMGGNQGSHIINKTVEQCLGELLKKVCIIHISGDNKYGDFERLKDLESGRYLVKRWIGAEFGAILPKIDLAICRAGINTLSELAYFKIPALVIPIPYLYQDEQNINAKYFASLGLVRILPQALLSADSLLKNIKLILNDFKERNKKIREVVNIDAAKRLALETILLVRKSKLNE